MNSELKAMLQLVFDGIAIGKDGLAKDYTALMNDSVKFLMAIPAVVQNFGDIKAEIAALPGSPQEADLIAFIEQQFATEIASGKAQAILASVLKLLGDAVIITQDSIAFANLLKS